MSLTKHPEGSLRELLSISFPLMLSEFSVMSMLFIDRMLLAHYSTDALNAAVNATTFGWVFAVSGIVLCGISKVFVAQYNGSGEKHRLGEPVWQMLYLGLASLLFFIPFAIWGTDLVYGPDRLYERDYFRWMMYFGSSYALYGALAGFFIGRGEVVLITVVALITNFMNAFMDMALIFGVEGWIPSLGVKGAAIATSSSSMFQVIVLFMVFMSRKNRENYGTANITFFPQLFWRCIKIGMPAATFVGFEVLGFATYYWIMTLAGKDYITVAGIAQSVIILFFFFGEGIMQAVTTIVGNLIGAGRSYLVSNVVRVGLRLHFLFFLFIFIFLFFESDFVIALFLPDASPEDLNRLHQPLTLVLYSSLFYLLFEGIRLLFAGVMMAAGDTLFLMVGGSLSIWAFMVLPIYYVVSNGIATLETGPYICVFYSFLASVIYYARFTTGKWREMPALSQE